MKQKHTKYTQINTDKSIGATTVWDRGDWSPKFYVGDQQCIGPPTS